MLKNAPDSFLARLISRSRTRKTTLLSITQRLLFPFALTALLLSIGVGALLYWQSHLHTQERLTQKRTMIGEQLSSLLSQQAMGLGIAAKTVAADPQTLQALAQSDREALFTRWISLYRELNQTHHLTHFYFFDTQRICLLRLHHPQKKGDLINRFTALEAQWRGRASYGLELGPLGTLTLRYVQPLFDGDRLIGYVELGKEIEDLLKQLSSSFGVELLLLIKKNHLNQKEWEAGMAMLQRSASWSEHNDTVLVYASSEAHRRQLEAIRQEHAYTLNDRHFVPLRLSIFDAALKEVGYLKAIVDVTQTHLNTRHLILWSVLLALLLSAVLIGLFYLLLRYTDKALLAGQYKLRESEERFAQLTQFNRTVVWECDTQGRYTYISDSAYDILGYFPDEMVGMLHCWDLAPEASREALKAQMLERFARHQPFRDLVTAIEHQRGHPLWRSSSALPILSSNGTLLGYRGSDRDITEQKRSEETIKTLAFYDTLTGLPNRKLLQDRFKQALASSKRNDRYGAILLLDLDHFKTLNDTMGHQQGDLLLVQVAAQIVSATREGDTVARLGGDEFVVLLGDLGDMQNDAALAAETVGQKLIAALDRLYPLDALEYRSSASIGITLFQGDEASSDDLLKQADIAMYRAKESGRNTISFFDPKTEAALHQKTLLKEELRYAIEHSELVVFYQAQVDEERRICGAEALVRWNHPVRGLVSPAAFIPIAEESGLIVPLGLWVLRSVARQSVAWQSEPLMRGLRISVNVSVRQFMQHDFVDQVRAVIDETAVDPSLLKFEMTESILARNTEEIIVKMEQLKAMGIGFSLDDFGTGYSSLGYLKQLPIDQLKIDQSFVRDILSNPNDKIICKSTIALAYSMGLDVIAEGVETLSQRDALLSLGCRSYQGFFFAPALCVEDFERMRQKEAA